METVSLNTGTIAGPINNDDVERLMASYNFRRGPKDKNLAISSVKEEIINAIDTNPVVIIQGPTGCGKTTQVPQYILENCFEKRVGCNIIGKPHCQSLINYFYLCLKKKQAN